MIVFGIKINDVYAGFGASETLECAQQENNPLMIVEMASGEDQQCKNLVDYFTYLNNNTAPFGDINEYGITDADIYTLSTEGDTFVNSRNV